MLQGAKLKFLVNCAFEDFAEFIDLVMIREACASTWTEFKMMKLENMRFEQKKSALEPLLDWDNWPLCVTLYNQNVFKLNKYKDV